MLIVVEGKSKFGVLDAQTKQWLNPSDKELLNVFKVGKAYDVELVENTGKNGKVYKNIQSAKEHALDGPVVATVPVAKKAFVPKREVKQETDWAAKDRSQLVGGRSHDAVVLVQTSLASCTPMADVLKLYREALDGILAIAREVK